VPPQFERRVIAAKMARTFQRHSDALFPGLTAAYDRNQIRRLKRADPLEGERGDQEIDR
jgi:hypothetical protein